MFQSTGEYIFKGEYKQICVHYSYSYKKGSIANSLTYNKQCILSNGNILEQIQQFWDQNCWAYL